MELETRVLRIMLLVFHKTDQVSDNFILYINDKVHFFEQVFLEQVSDLFPSACNQYLNESCIDDTSKDTLYQPCTIAFKFYDFWFIFWTSKL